MRHSPGEEDTPRLEPGHGLGLNPMLFHCLLPTAYFLLLTAHRHCFFLYTPHACFITFMVISLEGD